MNQARSRAIDRLRFESRKKRSNGGAEQPQAEIAANPSDVLELREQGEALRAALSALTPDERQAIETTFFAGLTHAEAATRLNQPLGTIKTRIRSGLHKPACWSASRLARATRRIRMRARKSCICSRASCGSTGASWCRGDYNYGAPGALDESVWSERGTCVLVTNTEDLLR